MPLKWAIEMPSAGGSDDQFGGCRGIEGTYTRIKQIGEGTYGQVRLCAGGTSSFSCEPAGSPCLLPPSSLCVLQRSWLQGYPARLVQPQLTICIDDLHSV